MKKISLLMVVTFFITYYRMDGSVSVRVGGYVDSIKLKNKSDHTIIAAADTTSFSDPKQKSIPPGQSYKFGSLNSLHVWTDRNHHCIIYPYEKETKLRLGHPYDKHWIIHYKDGAIWKGVKKLCDLTSNGVYGTPE